LFQGARGGVCRRGPAGAAPRARRAAQGAASEMINPLGCSAGNPPLKNKPCHNPPGRCRWSTRCWRGRSPAVDHPHPTPQNNPPGRCRWSTRWWPGRRPALDTHPKPPHPPPQKKPQPPPPNKDTHQVNVNRGRVGGEDAGGGARGLEVGEDALLQGDVLGVFGGAEAAGRREGARRRDAGAGESAAAGGCGAGSAASGPARRPLSFPAPPAPQKGSLPTPSPPPR
jgi:hypothetical protein